MLTRFRTTAGKQRKERIGTVTEDFIKDSREALHQQKEDLEKDR